MRMGRHLRAATAAALLLTACGGEEPTNSGGYPHAKEPIATVRQMYDGQMLPDIAVNTMRNIDRIFPVRTVAHGQTVYPLPQAEKQLTQVTFTSGERTYDLVDFLTMNRVSGLLVIKDGKIAYETYQLGNTEKTRWMSMSVAKSITSTLIGAAIKDGAIASIDDPVTKYVPRLAGTSYENVTVRNILMMASGVAWDETYTDPSSDRRALLEAQISQKPGSALDVMAKLGRAAEPGARWNYSTGETQVAGEILLGAVKKPLAQYLSEKIWSRFGMEADANWWLDSPDGHEIGGSGFSATLRDYGRFGLFFLNGGKIGDEELLPPGWMAEAGSPKVLVGDTPLPNYGYMWWPVVGSTEGAFTGTGIFGQRLYINPTHKVVIAKWGADPKPGGRAPLDDLAFFAAVTQALQ